MDPMRRECSPCLVLEAHSLSSISLVLSGAGSGNRKHPGLDSSRKPHDLLPAPGYYLMDFEQMSLTPWTSINPLMNWDMVTPLKWVYPTYELGYGSIHITGLSRSGMRW